MVAKGLCVRGELETEQTSTYWPPVPLSSAALLSRSTGLLNRGSWGPIAFCWVLVLSTASYLQLTPTNWPSCHTGLYHYLTSTCFLWASHLHPIQPVHSQGYTLISSTGCTCSLIEGWVGGQYVTSFSRTDSGLCIYHLVVWPRFHLLHNSLWITFPIQSQSYLVLRFFLRWFVLSAYYMINSFIFFSA